MHASVLIDRKRRIFLENFKRVAPFFYFSCPVCRYVQTPEPIEDQMCMQCESQDVSPYMHCSFTSYSFHNKGLDISCYRRKHKDFSFILFLVSWGGGGVGWEEIVNYLGFTINTIF